ncbi:MAG: hypothetical protein OXH52_06200 [Gammaproteobacteria bacterium]|nr:hypothetical protein [Gammaproteobacteria bacterium]
MDVFVFAILITVILGSIHLTKLWIRRNASATSARTDTLEDEVDALRERVETLERIVTDEKYTLDREIEKLEDE